VKRVIAKRTEPRCRVCSSGNRERFDGFLQLYLNGEEDESGDKLSWRRLEILSGVLTGNETRQALASAATGRALRCPGRS
jgi:hypothetical protein